MSYSCDTNFDRWLGNYCLANGLELSDTAKLLARDAWEYGFVAGNIQAIKSRVTQFMENYNND